MQNGWDFYCFLYLCEEVEWQWIQWCVARGENPKVMQGWSPLWLSGSLSSFPARECIVQTHIWHGENAQNIKLIIIRTYSLIVSLTALVYSELSSRRMNVHAVISGCKLCCIRPLFLICVWHCLWPVLLNHCCLLSA